MSLQIKRERAVCPEHPNAPAFMGHANQLRGGGFGAGNLRKGLRKEQVFLSL